MVDDEVGNVRLYFLNKASKSTPTSSTGDVDGDEWRLDNRPGQTSIDWPTEVNIVTVGGDLIDDARGYFVVRMMQETNILPVWDVCSFYTGDPSHFCLLS